MRGGVVWNVGEVRRCIGNGGVCETRCDKVGKVGEGRRAVVVRLV